KLRRVGALDSRASATWAGRPPVSQARSLPRASRRHAVSNLEAIALPVQTRQEARAPSMASEVPRFEAFTMIGAPLCKYLRGEARDFHVAPATHARGLALVSTLR